MIQLPQLQESLLLANDRLVERARRRARRFRLGLMTSAAVVSLGGAAVAGTALWGPVLGFEDGNRPTASSTPVPASQLAVLGVLRRDQTAADRGPVAREALALATKQYVGIRVASVRVLHDAPSGKALVLVPVANLQPVAADAPSGVDDVCVVARTRPRDLAVQCFGTDEVRRGLAAATLGDLGWGLVPDGVARVAVRTRTGGTTELPVASNAFTVDTGLVAPDRPEVEWLDDEGRTVVPEGGTPMRVYVPPAG